MMTIAKRVRDCRYAKGWGPDELASRAAISRTALYQIECGKTETPRAGTLRRIAEALDVSIESLLGNEAPRSPESPKASRFEAAVPASWSQETESRLKPEPATPAILARESELQSMLHELLSSPFGDGIARIIQEAHRVIPSMDRSLTS